MTSKPLNIPLYKRSYTGLWHALACFFIAIVLVKPGAIESWLTSIFLVFPTLWFVFVGPKFTDAWLRRSPYGFISWGVLAVKLALFFWVINILEPYAALRLGEWLMIAG